jgi:hypothetical protein
VHCIDADNHGNALQHLKHLDRQARLQLQTDTHSQFPCGGSS